MDYAQKIIRGTAVVFIMMVATAALGYLFMLLLTKKLSIIEFGLFFAVFNVISLFYGFKGAGMGAAVVRQVTEHRVSKNDAGVKQVIVAFFIIQVIVFGLISAAILLLSKYLTAHYFKDPSAFWILFVLIIAFFFSIFVTTFRSIFHSYQEMGKTSLVEFLQTLFLLIFSVLFFAVGFKYMAPAYAYLASFLVVAVITFYMSLKIFPLLKVKSFPDKKTFMALIKFGAPVMLGMIGVSIIQSIDVIAITYFKSLTDVALYSIALPISNLLRFIPRALVVVVLPITSELHITDAKQLSNGITQIYKYLFVIMVPMAMTLVVFPELLITLAFGSKFVGAAMALRILAIGVVFISIYMVNQYIILGINQPKDYTKTILISAVVSLVLNVVFVLLWGIVGAALAVTISAVVMLLQSSFQIKKRLDFRIPYLDWFKTLLAGGVFISVVFQLGNVMKMNMYVEAAISLVFGLLVYLWFILVLVLNLTSVKDVKNLINIARTK